MSLTYSHIINGITVNPPKDWQEQQITIDFRQEQVLDAFGGDTPLIDLGTLVFVNDGGNTFKNKAAQTLIDYVDGGIDGTNGLFEDITYQIQFNDDQAGVNGTMFDGYLDMETYIQKSPVRVEIEARSFKDVNALVGRIQSNSFGFLEAQGLITQSDFINVPVVIESQDDAGVLFALEALVTLMAIQLAQAVKQLGTDLVAVAAFIATLPGGALGAGVWIIGSAFLSIVLIAIITTRIFILLIRMAEIVLPPVFQYKGILLRRLLEIATEFLGFDLESPIDELDNVVYLPSNPSSDFNIIDSVISSVQGFPLILSGVPRPSDFGYFISDYFNLVGRLFNGKFDITEDTLHFKSENDPYWRNISTFKPKAVADRDINALDQKFEERVFNINEFKANRLFSFATDPSDSWTAAYFKGTNFEVITQVKSFKSRKLSRRGGLKKVEFPTALGNRKSQLTEVEETAAKIADAIIVGITAIQQLGFNFPPGIVDLIDIKRRIGALRISNKVHTVPKLIFMDGGKIPINQRQLWSAKVLWDKYWVEKSFVQNGFRDQKLIIDNQIIPFTPTDFANIIDSSFYTTQEGQEARAVRLRWTPDSDEAILSSWVRQPYCDKLVETFVEAE